MPRLPVGFASYVGTKPAVALAIVFAGIPFAIAQGPTLVVRPAEVKLQGNFDRVQLLAASGDASGSLDDRSGDVTPDAQFVSSDPNIVTVTPQGRLLAIHDGQAKIVVTANGQSKDCLLYTSDAADE